MASAKPVVGFTDSLRVIKQEFAPTMYAIGKTFAARTPIAVSGTTNDANCILRPGLYVIPLNGSFNLITEGTTAASTNTKDYCFIYQLSSDIDDSSAGGHVVDKSISDMNVRQIAYFTRFNGNDFLSSTIKTRVGIKSTSIPANVTTVFNTLKDMYNAGAYSTWLYAFVSEIGMWVRIKNGTGSSRKMELAVDWTEWQDLGSGGSNVGYMHMPVRTMDSSLTNAEVNTIYVNFFNRSLIFPDAADCQLGDTIRLDQWNVNGTIVINDVSTVVPGGTENPKTYIYEVTIENTGSIPDASRKVWIRTNSGDSQNYEIYDAAINGVKLKVANHILSASAALAASDTIGTVMAKTSVFDQTDTTKNYSVPTVSAVYSLCSRLESKIDDAVDDIGTVSGNINTVSNRVALVSNVITDVSSVLSDHLESNPLSNLIGTSCIKVVDGFGAERNISLYLDATSRRGVLISTVLDGQDFPQLMATGVPAKEDVFGVVKLVNKVSGIDASYDADGLNPIYYTLPTMNAISLAIAAVSGTGGGGGGLPVKGNAPMSATNKTTSYEIDLTFNSTFSNGVTLSKVDNKLAAVASFGSTRTNNSTGCGVVFVNTTITSLTETNYNNQQGKYTVPTAQAVYNHVETRVPTAVAEYLAQHPVTGGSYNGPFNVTISNGNSAVVKGTPVDNANNIAGRIHYGTNPITMLEGSATFTGDGPHELYAYVYFVSTTGNTQYFTSGYAIGTTNIPNQAKGQQGVARLIAQISDGQVYQTQYGDIVLPSRW